MQTALDVLAQNNFGDTRTGGLAGPLGLLIVTMLAVATVLLIRNMNARLRRLPAEFPAPADPAGTDPAGTDAARADGEEDRADEAVRPDKAP